MTLVEWTPKNSLLNYFGNIDRIFDNFFPYLSINVDVIGVKSIDEIPKEPIKTPIWNLSYCKLSRKSGSKKKEEKFMKKKQFAIVAKIKSLFSLNIVICNDCKLTLTKRVIMIYSTH